MEPNALPIVCLPLELSEEDASALIDFRYQLVDALERHYGGLLINRIHERDPTPSSAPPSSSVQDPPF